ncbi:MAG: chromate resistance protein ChrB domain-containing protein, partial [Longimicrobiales bacterium]
NDTSVSLPQESAISPRNWLLLVTQLPSQPDYLRVKLQRRLRKVGAVPVRSSVYLLPGREECAEDFAWLRRELVSEGGDALLATASFVSGLTDAEASSLFREDRDARYAEITEAAKAELERLGGALPATSAEMAGAHRRLRRKLDEVMAIDFFEASGRTAAEHAVGRVGHLAGGDAAMSETMRRDARPEVARGSRWVTRRGVRVDRMASAWLIRRFIDSDAAFAFVAPESSAAESGVYRFDMFEGEFTHEGDRCTFETLVSRFGLAEETPALRAVGEVVHDIDCKDGKYGRAETAGVSALIEGVTAREASDERRVEAGFRIFEDLYAWFARESS